MATSENALPKLLRDYLARIEFPYDRVKTTPNFTYDLSRVIKTPVDAEYDPQAEGVAFDLEVTNALKDFGVTTFKTVSVAYDEMTPPQDEDVRMHRLTARIKAIGYEAPEPVFKEKVKPPKKEKKAKEPKEPGAPEGLKVLINLGGEKPVKEAKPKKEKKAPSGKKGIVQAPAVDAPIDGADIAEMAEV